MPAPINYTQGFVDPTQSMMQTLQMGGMLSQMGAARDQRAAAQQAATDKAARDKEIREAYDFALKNPTAENFQKLASYYPPEQQDAIRKGYTMLDEAAQKTLLNDSMDVFIAFDSGQPDIAISRMEEKVEAYKNAGNEKAAKEMQTLIDLAKTGEKGAQGVAGMFGANISLMDKEAMEGYAKYKEEQRASAAEPDVIKKRLADIGYTEAQTNKFLAETRKLDAETKKIAIDLETMGASGGLDPEKKFASELALNKEYTTRAKGYEESLRLSDVISASAEANTGAGDLALITTFMKMLDPGSVVRESEFAKAQDTAGLLGKLTATATKVQSGQILTPAQRKEFVALAGKYMQASTDHEKRVREGLDLMVKNYSLNPENVFGLKAQDKPQAGTATTAAVGSDIDALKAYIVSRFPGEAAKINSLDLAGLQREYPKSVESYKPAGASTATIPAASTVPQTVVEADF